ncbi:MAG: ABC transporter permease, partial [Myxococcota bacterium]|nr:ABC transporter permease [Myxococcota bacterium]
LTGVGVQVAPEHAEGLPDLRERYQKEPELQVVSLSQVEQALRQAMVAMGDVAQVLAGVLALMAAALLLNTTLLRTLGEHRRLFVLHAIGFRRRFIYGVALVENIALVVTGACLGLGCSVLFAGWSSAFLSSYLPYAPQGNLVILSGDVIGGVLGGALLIGILATLPPLARIRSYGDISALRES